MNFSFPQEINLFGIYFPSIMAIVISGVIAALICQKSFVLLGLDNFLWHGRLVFISAAASFSALLFIIF